MRPHSAVARAYWEVTTLTDSVEAELLGACTADVTAYWEVAHEISPDMLEQPHLGEIWEAIGEAAQSMDRQTTVVPLTELSTRIGEQARKVLMMLYGEGLPSHAPYLAREVQARYTRRQLRLAGEQIAHLAERETDVGQALTQAQEMVHRLQAPGSEASYASMDDVVDATLAEIETAMQGARRGVPTGFKRLDRELGNLQPGGLTVLAARTGVGKTMFATNLAVQSAKQGNCVLMFSLEMSRSELGYRIIGTEAGIPAPRLRNASAGDPLQPQQVEAVRAAQLRLHETPFWVVDESRLSSASIHSWARRQMGTTGLDLVIIDYLQLVNDRLEKRQRVEEVGYTAKAAKRLARTLDVPVVAVAQLSRSAEEYNRPQLRHLRESGDIEQEADVVLFLARQYDREDGELIIAKNRHGRQAILPVQQVSIQNRWVELEQEVEHA